MLWYLASYLNPCVWLYCCGCKMVWTMQVCRFHFNSQLHIPHKYIHIAFNSLTTIAHSLENPLGCVWIFTLLRKSNSAPEAFSWPWHTDTLPRFQLSGLSTSKPGFETFSWPLLHPHISRLSIVRTLQQRTLLLTENQIWFAYKGRVLSVPMLARWEMLQPELLPQNQEHIMTSSCTLAQNLSSKPIINIRPKSSDANIRHWWLKS